MFTGLVERTGKILSISQPAAATASLMGGITQLIVDAGKGYETNVGDSVSVNGCCLTVTSNKFQMLAFDVSSETLKLTNLGDLGEGTEVNLERALQLGDRLGGHMVSGHVDGVGAVVSVGKKPEGWELRASLSKALSRYVICKGSICLDGVSLTVNTVDDHTDHTEITVMLIPTTVSLTSFRHLAVGQRLNIEVDLVGKYVERLTQRVR
ncbi:MAG: riboflavin synthase [Deltaproteobacteria bacterium]|nr:riboflavin synthase [Deltaproteobacteria bacterium]